MGLPYSLFLNLASAGLFASDPNAGWQMGEAGESSVLLTYEPYLLLFERGQTSGPRPLTFTARPVTVVGKELARLISIEHNWDYVKLLAVEVGPNWRLASVLTPHGFPSPPDLPTQFTGDRPQSH
jgi:hypothetical protein